MLVAYLAVIVNTERAIVLVVLVEEVEEHAGIDKLAFEHPVWRIEKERKHIACSMAVNIGAERLPAYLYPVEQGASVLLIITINRIFPTDVCPELLKKIGMMH